MPHVQGTRHVGRRHDDAVRYFVGVWIRFERPASLPFSVPASLDGPVVVSFRNLLTQEERYFLIICPRRTSSGIATFPSTGGFQTRPLLRPRSEATSRRSLLHRRSTSGSRLRATAEHRP